MKVKSYFQICRKEPCFLAQRMLSLVGYAEAIATFFSFCFLRGKYTSHASLIHSQCSFVGTQTNKLTNKSMDGQTE